MRITLVVALAALPLARGSAAEQPNPVQQAVERCKAPPPRPARSNAAFFGVDFVSGFSADCIFLNEAIRTYRSLAPKVEATEIWNTVLLSMAKRILGNAHPPVDQAYGFCRRPDPSREMMSACEALRVANTTGREVIWEPVAHLIARTAEIIAAESVARREWLERQDRAGRAL